MLPSVPGGTSCPVANLAHAGGSNFNPSGSFCPVSSLGSIPVLGTSVT